MLSVVTSVETQIMAGEVASSVICSSVETQIMAGEVASSVICSYFCRNSNHGR